MHIHSIKEDREITNKHIKICSTPYAIRKLQLKKKNNQISLHTY